WTHICAGDWTDRRDHFPARLTSPGAIRRGLAPGGGVLWGRGGPVDGGEHTVFRLGPDTQRGRKRRNDIRPSRSARAVASDGPYQVSRRPGSSTTRYPGNSSGPSAAVNG